MSPNVEDKKLITSIMRSVLLMLLTHVASTRSDTGVRTDEVAAYIEGHDLDGLDQALLNSENINLSAPWQLFITTTERAMRQRFIDEIREHLQSQDDKLLWREEIFNYATQYEFGLVAAV